MFMKKIKLWGDKDALMKARGLLENLPGIVRVDFDASVCILYSGTEIKEGELLALLPLSGINGFRISQQV